MTDNDKPRRGPFRDGERPRRPGRPGDKKRFDRGPRRSERPEGESREAGARRLSEAAEEKRDFLESKMPGLAARRAALDILGLMRRGRTLDEALAQTRSLGALDGPDRAFARNMVSTSWRRRGAIDAVIGHYLDRPLPAKNAEVMDILRLAAVQLLILQTPAHAAVATATELAGQKQETRPYAKLVNAISRRLSDKGAAQLAAQPPRVNTPGWLWRSLERAYGPSGVAAIAEANATEAPLDLSLKPGIDGSALMALDGAQSLLPGHVRLSASHAVTDLPGFESGDWWVQDFAASLPARLLGAVDGQTVLDLCAAPGGKTLQLVAAGATVTAVDIAGHRLTRLTENLARTGLTAATAKADVLDWSPEAPVDAVLLDAPCTATGTIRRNPDVAWSKSEKDVKDLSALQAKMLDRALTFLKPGGHLVYCVCSLIRAEGEDQIKAALDRHEGLEIVPADASMLPGMEKAITKSGAIRTLPSMRAAEGGMDGFYAVLLRKAG